MIYRRIQGLVCRKVREHRRLRPYRHLQDVQGIGGGHIPSEFRIQAFHFFKGNTGGFSRGLQMDWTRDRHLLVLDWRLRENIESKAAWIFRNLGRRHKAGHVFFGFSP